MVNSKFIESLEEHILVSKSLQGIKNEFKILSQALINSLNASKKILIAGNGGSASDAQHIVAELVGTFEKKKRPLPALALNTDTSVMTSIGNDFGYDFIISRQLQALGQKGDVFIAISTSGNSSNLLQALEVAETMGIDFWCLTGKGGGEFYQRWPQKCIVVPSSRTARIQEMHILLGHCLCEDIDEEFADAS